MNFREYLIDCKCFIDGFEIQRNKYVIILHSLNRSFDDFFRICNNLKEYFNANEVVFLIFLFRYEKLMIFCILQDLKLDYFFNKISRMKWNVILRIVRKFSTIYWQISALYILKKAISPSSFQSSINHFIMR